MTWSRSAAGAPQVAIEAAEHWGEQVEQMDRLAGTPTAIAQQHQLQIDRCVRAVSEFAGSLPYGYHMSVTANGSVNLAGSPENWSVSLSAYKPVPNVTARVLSETLHAAHPPFDNLGDPLE